MYTGVDGITSRKLKLQDCLKEEPMTVCLTETTLNKVIQMVLD